MSNIDKFRFIWVPVIRCYDRSTNQATATYYVDVKSYTYKSGIVDFWATRRDSDVYARTKLHLPRQQGKIMEVLAVTEDGTEIRDFFDPKEWEDILLDDPEFALLSSFFNFFNNKERRELLLRHRECIINKINTLDLKDKEDNSLNLYAGSEASDIESHPNEGVTRIYLND